MKAFGVRGRQILAARSSAFRPAGRYNDRHPAHLRDLAPTEVFRPLDTARWQRHQHGVGAKIHPHYADLSRLAERHEHRSRARAERAAELEQQRVLAAWAVLARDYPDQWTDALTRRVAATHGVERAAWALRMPVDVVRALAGGAS